MKKHKIIFLINLLLLFALILSGTSLIQNIDPEAGISQAVGVWVALIVTFEVLILPLVMLVKSSRHHDDVQPINPQQRKMAKASGISILLGASLGVAVTLVLVAKGGTDAGLLLLPIMAILVPLGAFIGYTVSKVSLGDHTEKRRALYIFLGISLILGVIILYSNYQTNHEQKYCDGVPVEQYQGELPTYCTV